MVGEVSDLEADIVLLVDVRTDPTPAEPSGSLNGVIYLILSIA
jgi:hypothetical protein